LGFAHPHRDIIKKYLELGGKYITIGSDAHRASEIASNFDKVYDLLKELDIKEITVYEKRKPILISI